MGERQCDPAAVELNEDVLEDILRVRARFDWRNTVVAIAIDQRDDTVRNRRSWRQIDFQHQTRALERDARSLQIFVEAMGGWGRRQNENEYCRRRERASHRLVILAA